MDKGYSTIGVAFYLAGAPVDWKSVNQTNKAASTLESKYGVVESVSNDSPPRHFLKTIRREQSEATVVFKGGCCSHQSKHQLYA